MESKKIYAATITELEIPDSGAGSFFYKSPSGEQRVITYGPVRIGHGTLIEPAAAPVPTEQK
jgi:hypothetical protein